MCGSYVCMNGLPHRTKAKTNSLVCSDTTTFCVFFKSTECLHTRVYLSTMYLCTTHNGMAERFAFTKCIFNNLLLKSESAEFLRFLLCLRLIRVRLFCLPFVSIFHFGFFCSPLQMNSEISLRSNLRHPCLFWPVYVHFTNNSACLFEAKRTQEKSLFVMIVFCFRSPLDLLK